jgi:hypothetical protein
MRRLSRSAALWLLLVVGLLAMAPGLIHRVAIEQGNATYELSMPDDQLVAILHAGVEPDVVYGDLRASGLGSVAVAMQTIADLEEAGEIVIFSRPEMLERLLFSEDSASTLPRGDGTFISVIDEETRALEALKAVDPTSRIERVEVSGLTFHFVSGIEAIEEVSVGYDDARIRALRDRGLEVIARVPEAFNAPDFLIAELDRLKRQFGVTRVLFTGDRAPSAASPENLRALAGWLRDEGFALMLIEFEAQEGVDSYIDIIGHGIRLHSIDLGREADPTTSVERAVRAIKERSIRVIFLRANETIGAPGRLEGLSGVLAEIQTSLPAGFHAGVAQPFAPLSLSPLLAIGALASSVAIAALTGLLLGSTISTLAGALTALVGTGVLATGAPLLGDLFRLGIAILSAILALYVTRPTPRWLPATSEYLKAALVIFAGGLTLTALAYDNRFLLNAENFWGVKALLLAPPLIATAVATHRSLGSARWSDSLAVLRMPVRAWHIGALALAGFAAWYFLLRSGNTGAATDFELVLRQELENLLYVRPRTKEFLIGFPALLVGIVVAARGRYGWWLYVVAAVGAASAIDSFTHFHQPLLVSTLRTGLSIVLGFGIGLAALAILGPLDSFIRRTSAITRP